MGASRDMEPYNILLDEEIHEQPSNQHVINEKLEGANSIDGKLEVGGGVDDKNQLLRK